MANDKEDQTRILAMSPDGVIIDFPDQLHSESRSNLYEPVYRIEQNE